VFYLAALSSLWKDPFVGRNQNFIIKDVRRREQITVSAGEFFAS